VAPDDFNIVYRNRYPCSGVWRMSSCANIIQMVHGDVHHPLNCEIWIKENGTSENVPFL